MSERYRPKSFSEFVGNDELVKEITDLIKNNKSVIVVGSPGIGKTSLAYVLSKELNLDLVLTNASDERRCEELKEIERSLKMRPFFPTLVVLDECDGISDWSILLRILKKSKSPLYMTANDKRSIPKEIFKFAKFFEFKPLKTVDVARRIKQISQSEGVEVKLDKITNDLRESINRVFFDSDTYERHKSDFDKVDEIFKHKKFTDINPIWLIDNVTNYYQGADLINSVNIINLYKKYKNIEILKALPVAKDGRPQYPNFYRLMLRKDG